MKPQYLSRPITVKNCTTGEILEFTEGDDHDLIRMRFEGIQAIREKMKSSADISPLYEVTFHTTGDDLTVSLLENQYYFVIGGYKYEAIRSGIDLLYFENLFLQ